MDEMAAMGELLWLLVADPGTGVLLAILVAAAVIDYRTLRIPNWITLPAIVYGLAYNATHATSVTAGLATAGFGLAAGLLLLLPLYVLRVMGAGDVKLMAAIGAFLGAGPTLTAALFVFIAGGLAAVAFALSRGAAGRFVANLRFILMGLLLPGGGLARMRLAAAAPSIGKLPYGLSIAAGTTAFLVARQLGFL